MTHNVSTDELVLERERAALGDSRDPRDRADQGVCSKPHHAISEAKAARQDWLQELWKRFASAVIAPVDLNQRSLRKAASSSSGSGGRLS